MGDGGKETKPNGPDAEGSTGQSTSREATLEQARKFLQDAQVQNTTPERKVEFLKSKGLSESNIEALLKEVSQDSQASEKSRDERMEPPIKKKEERPLIITYPEFLTRPPRPPPLVTINGFFNTLYTFGSISTLVYGASKYVVEPMVNTLTEARISLHDTAHQDLAKLVSKLESVVSEIPPAKPKETKTIPPSPEDMDGNASQYDDPTELFHRDIGVQTSPLPSPLLPSSQMPPHYQQQQQQEEEEENPTAQQTRRLTSLVASLKTLNEKLVAQADSYGEVQVVLDLLHADLNKLSGAHTTDFVGGSSLYGAAGRNQPDDEIKRAKENIRRVKGVLLSTRSFPAISPARQNA